jgi:hypothetical protein
VRLVEHCEHCGLLTYSSFKDATKLIDLNLWDGSDFIMVWPLPRFIFVTERAKNVIERAGLEGAVFVPIEKLLPSKHRHLSPGRLSYWMPKERAHQLGELYGIE